MKLTTQLKNSIDACVLFWLATSSKDNIPNVSPKEMVTHYKSEYIIIANIASPQTVKNCKQNKNVCISFIDILVQKGFQLKGKASIITHTDAEYSQMKMLLEKMTEGNFPFKTITKISIDSCKKILAPRYILYPQTTEKEQINNAKRMYQLL